LPADLPTVKASSNPIGLLALIREAGFASSNSEARRFVEQGAVSLNGEKTTDAKATIQIADKTILKVGKRKICEVSG